MLSAKLDKKPGELLKLHIFVDHSTIEVFADYKETISTRIYPTREDSVLTEIFAIDGSVKIKQLQTWSMKSIWNQSEEISNEMEVKNMNA
jgi:beta-fructofuranosidase